MSPDAAPGPPPTRSPHPTLGEQAGPGVKFAIDAWDPSYGSSLEGDLAVSQAEVNPAVELPPGQWRPLPPPVSAVPPSRVLFVDGVRRVEARVWVEGPGGDVRPGLCASFAAGVVRCASGARIVEVEVGRGVWSASPAVADIETRHGTFRAGTAASDAPEALSLALQDAMTAAEVRNAERARAACGVGGAHSTNDPDAAGGGGSEGRGGEGLGESDLIVVDGPLRGRQHLPDTIGLVKTHHVKYLPPALDRVVGDLGSGERTPVFSMRSSWSRHSWYLRLPGPPAGPWGGIVRCEAPADLAPAAAVALAGTVAATLPRFASEPHKDARAPQNLYPIAGLERELRRRLGEQAVLLRALRRAAGDSAGAAI